MNIRTVPNFFVELWWKSKSRHTKIMVEILKKYSNELKSLAGRKKQQLSNHEKIEFFDSRRNESSIGNKTNISYFKI